MKKEIPNGLVIAVLAAVFFLVFCYPVCLSKALSQLVSRR